MISHYLSIRNQFTLFTTLFLLILLALTVFLSFLFGFPDYTALQRKTLEREIEQLRNVVAPIGEDLDLLCRDWAFWNDTWEFVQQPNEEYIESNLGTEQFLTSETQFTIYFDKNGRCVYQAGWLGEAGAYLQQLYPADHPDPVLFGAESSLNKTEQWINYGFVRTGEGHLILFISRAILKSNHDGPAEGVLVMGKNLDASFLRRITLNIQRPIALEFSLPEKGRIAPFRDQAMIQKTAEKGSLFDTWNVFVAYHIQPDDDPFYLRFEYTPEIRHQGIITIIRTNLFILTIFLILAGVYFLVINRRILKPLADLSAFVERESHKLFGSDMAEIPRHGNEIYSLTARFGRLIADIEEKHRNLEFLADTDELTGLENRRSILGKLSYFTKRSGDDWERQPIGVIMIDVDHFKNINDTYGHTYGDKVLKKLAGLIRGCLRGNDYCGRYGGEEIIVIVSRQPGSIVANVAERIRQQIAAQKWDRKDLQVTVSAGWAVTETSCDPETLIARADEYLYKAKRNGRNRVEGKDIS